jgi:hypothetical protein
MITAARIQRARLQAFLAKFERAFNRLLYLTGAAVLFAAQADPSWAAVLGRWGGLATLAIGFIASEIRKGRPQA